MDGLRTEEIDDYLNRKGIAVRGGHHCAQPILRRYRVERRLRATLALYNTFEEMDTLVAALWELRQGRNPGLDLPQFHFSDLPVGGAYAG
jgi:cysteine desulfurase / selenocysteine lyase